MTAVYGPFYDYGYGGFPFSIIDAQVELQLGNWTGITPYVLQREGTGGNLVTITRGRPDETSKATPSQCAMQWNNRDGRFSPRNPTGPYYGSLVRNTPLRVSVPASGVYLRFDDDTTSFISTSGLSLNPAGDMEIQLDLQLNSYLPCILASKDNIAGQRSWNLQLNPDGTLAFQWSHDGTAMHSGSSSLPLPLGRISLRVTLATATGTVTWYTSTTPINSSPSWTQLGVPFVLGSSATVFSSNTSILVGFNSATSAFASTPFQNVGGMTGKVFGFRLYSGIAGTLQASPDFTTATPGAATLTDAQSNVWTLTGTAAFSGRSFRFHGECSSLPQQWDTSGTDVWTPVTASGILRRKQQGTIPILSAMKRAVTSWPAGPSTVSSGASAPLSTVAYWAAEDAAGATQIAAAGPNSDGNTVRPMTVAGAPAFQGTVGSKTADSVFACSAQLPQVGSSSWTGLIPAYNSAASAASLMFLLQIPSGGTANNAILLAVNLGPNLQLAVEYQTGSGGSLNLYVTSGGTLGITFGPTGVNGQALWVQLVNDGSNSTTFLNTLQLGAAAPVSTAGSSSGNRIMTSVQVNPGAANLGTTIIGQIWAAAAWASGASYPALPSLSSATAISVLNAWAGETAGSRVGRLCGENSIQSRVYGYPAVTAAMGAQQIDTLANVLQSCEDADRGVLYEPRQCVGIGYRTSDSLLNQAAAVSLDYSLAELGGDQGQGLAPTDDDQFTINDVIVTRSGGSSAEVQVTTGPLSVNEPPSGAGDYNTTLTVYCQSDTQLNDIGGWITHVGTADAERYPVIPLNLARPALAALVNTILEADIGAYVSIANPPAWLPPGPIKILVWGTTEKLGGYFEAVAWNAIPEIPWEVVVLDDAVYGRLDTDGATVHANITSAATSMQADTTNAGSPLWTTAAGDFPFDILVSGEQMTVTGITGSSSPQTFTVTRSVNGVVKAQAAGTAVALFHTPVLAYV